MKKVIILLMTLVIFTGITLGQVPHLINYQGLLIDPATGQPVPDDTYSITFSIYNVASGGRAIWSETQSVETKNGLYSVLLGSTTALTSTILTGPEKYLGIKVGSDPEMTPRKRLVSVAYAVVSGDADKVDGKHATAFAESVHVHDNRYYTESELNTSDGDPPNQGSNRMSWDNLRDVPGGFADGVDDTSSGGGGGGWTDGGTNVYLTTSTDKVGVGDTSPTHKLDVAGKIGINDNQVLFLPDQTDFTGTLILGDGGGSLSHSSGDDGRCNTAIGIGALNSNTTGNSNIASGYIALYSNTTGHYNTASGTGALCQNTTGYSNTASGYAALYSNTTGHYNTASGTGALSFNETGERNTAIGYGALSFNTTGDCNTALGHGAVGTSGDLQNATAIGVNATVNASNKVVIGNTDVTVIGGYVPWSTYSTDARFNRSVQEDIKGLDFIIRLRPVSYKLDLAALNAHLGVESESDHEYVSNSNKGDIVYSGFIGQEVEAAAREAGYDFSGVVPPQNEQDHYSLCYAEFVVPLVKAVQEQQKMIEDMRNEIAALKKRLGE